MINAIKTLLNKTSELEEKINLLSKKTNTINNSNSFICFSKGLINLSFLNSNTMSIAKFETIKNSSLYFQNQIELNIPTKQTVKISLIVNDIVIYKSTRELEAGFNQITIMKSYTPLLSEQSELFLKITSENNSMITIITDTLFVWGLSNFNKQTEYQAIGIQDKILLSINTNDSLYYLTCTQNEEHAFNFEDFIFFGNSKSSSFVFDSENNILYLFRVDSDGNLFYKIFGTDNEMFIDTNVSHVSAAYGNNKLIFCTVKNGQCFICEINNGNISSPEPLSNINVFAVKTHLYFNPYNKKFYVIISDKNESNYITESISETEISHPYINVTYTITYDTY